MGGFEPSGDERAPNSQRDSIRHHIVKLKNEKSGAPAKRAGFISMR
jgi:hypothetical protein